MRKHHQEEFMDGMLSVLPLNFFRGSNAKSQLGLGSNGGSVVASIVPLTALGTQIASDISAGADHVFINVVNNNNAFGFGTNANGELVRYKWC